MLKYQNSQSVKVIWVNSKKETLCWSKRLWAFWNIYLELRTRKSRVVWECQLPNTSSTSSRPYLSDVAFFFLLLIPTFLVFVSSILLGGRPHSFCTLISHLLASIWEGMWFGSRMRMNEQDCKMSLIELSLIFKKS